MVWASDYDASWMLDEVFWAFPSRRRPQDSPRTFWSDYISWLAWICLVSLSDELEEVAGEKEVWVSLQTAVPVTQTGISGKNQ